MADKRQQAFRQTDKLPLASTINDLRMSPSF